MSFGMQLVWLFVCVQGALLVHGLGRLIAVESQGLRVKSFIFGFGPYIGFRIRSICGRTHFRFGVFPLGVRVVLLPEEKIYMQGSMSYRSQALVNCGGALLNMYVGVVILLFIILSARHVGVVFFNITFGSLAVVSLIMFFAKDVLCAGLVPFFWLAFIPLVFEFARWDLSTGTKHHFFGAPVYDLLRAVQSGSDVLAMFAVVSCIFAAWSQLPIPPLYGWWTLVALRDRLVYGNKRHLTAFRSRFL